ncbi:DUF6526 family protein [Pedobacter flavus]|uniref:DUF6526 family protein n=1 Tax=Pedobacter flavus TaxID=3113906 RepID=A0ABU7H3G1_9SPHI|nr:DUF6526 family protein [Pedobacter sp. VNH31]MEE1885572.1 DUF6526 family protein [Pedobacter sp. VNH31]
MSQNFQNHKRIFKPFHLFLIPVSLLGFIYSLYVLFNEFNYANASISLLFFLVLLSSALSRVSALKVQDRAIINEFKFRYYLLSGNTVNENLTKSQLIALRFASDEELIDLTKKAVTEKLSATAIKKSIKNWKADYNRV